jgi:hypothetical protein
LACLEFRLKREAFFFIQGARLTRALDDGVNKREQEWIFTEPLGSTGQGVAIDAAMVELPVTDGFKFVGTKFKGKESTLDLLHPKPDISAGADLDAIPVAHGCVVHAGILVVAAYAQHGCALANPGVVYGGW